MHSRYRAPPICLTERWLSELIPKEDQQIPTALLLGSKSTSIYNPILQVYVGLLKVVVHNNFVVDTGLLGEFKFVFGLCETFASSQLAKVVQAHILNAWVLG